MHIRRVAMAAWTGLGAVALALSFASAATSPAGPDVAGVRAGMTADQALEILKTRDANLNWRFFVRQLPGTSLTYKQAVHNSANNSPRGDMELNRSEGLKSKYTALLSPEPQQEKVLGVKYSRVYGADERPLVSATTEALTEKYGKPAASDHRMMFWSFDASGAARSIGAVRTAELSQCNSFDELAVDIGGAQYLRKLEKRSTLCGTTYVLAEIGSTGEVVVFMNLTMVNHAMTGQAFANRDKIVAAAQEAELAKQRGQAAGKKPDL